MDEAELRRFLADAGKEIADHQGNVIGYVSQPVRIRVNQPYLSRGGFVIVERDEASGEFVGTEFDALPHPQKGGLFPGGQSGVAWRAPTLEEALRCLHRYFPDPGGT